MKFLNILCIVIVFCCSCKLSKTTTQVQTPMPSTPATPPVAALSISTILKKMQANTIEAERMSGETNMDYKGKPMNIAVASTVRWRRDSIIWMNVKKMGFNVARVQVTPDSVFVINYFENSYIAKSISYVEKNFGVPLDFALLQNMLLGNPVFLTPKEKLSVEKSPEGDVILRGSDTRWKATYWLEPTTFLVKEMLFEEPTANRILKISYEKYDILKGGNRAEQKFAYLRTIQVESPQTGKASIVLDIDAESLEVNVPKNIRFEIPSQYQKVD